MRKRGRLALPLVLIPLILPLSARAKNLLANPGFDRGETGWNTLVDVYPVGQAQIVSESVVLTAEDAARRPDSGGVAFKLHGDVRTTATATLRQCVSVESGRRYATGGSFKVDSEQNVLHGLELGFFPTEDCSGKPTLEGGAWDFSSLPFDPYDTRGFFLPAFLQMTAPPGSRSARVQVRANGAGSSYAGGFSLDSHVDDLYLIVEPEGQATWLLPTSAHSPGTAGSFWTSDLTLSNPSAADTLATVKFLGHDVDGRSGEERTLYVPALQTVTVKDVIGSLFLRTVDYGALLIVAAPGLAVVAENTTPVGGSSESGTVGESLPAAGPADLVGSVPKSLFPIRETDAFRTNLVLASASEFPIAVHLKLFSSDGSVLGEDDVPLPPLGMKQINRVASSLGSPGLDGGRVEVSTATPDGLFAAYASLIDNATNDPRAVLPHETFEASPRAPNLLANPGFDRDLSGWTLLTSDSSPNATASASWRPEDSGGSSTSGSVRLNASSVGFGQYASARLFQCIAVTAGESYSFNARTRTDSSFAFHDPRWPDLSFDYFGADNCSGIPQVHYHAAKPYNGTSSNGSWVTAYTNLGPAPAGARSALVSISASAGDIVHGESLQFSVDDAFFGKGLSSWMSILPASAHASGYGTSFWMTDLFLANPGDEDASVYVDFLGNVHIGPGARWIFVVPARQLLTVRDVLGSVFGLSSAYGALRVTSTSPSLVVASQSSTPFAGTNGEVGESLPAFGPADLVGSVPKSLFPIRETDAFRTNLVLASASEFPIAVHLKLFSSDGSVLGEDDVPLPPLGMKQINRVASSLGSPGLDGGRVEVSTATPDGLFAAYASLIDNATNDPRALLPR